MSKRASHWKRKRQFWVSERSRRMAPYRIIRLSVDTSAITSAINRAFRTIQELVGSTTFAVSQFSQAVEAERARCLVAAWDPSQPETERIISWYVRHMSTWPLVHAEQREVLGDLVSDNAPGPEGIVDTDMCTDASWEAGVHAMIAEVKARQRLVETRVDCDFS